MAGVEIAKSFSISRQSVSKALQGMDSKVSRVLLEMARSNRIEVTKVNFERGVLFGRSVQLNADAIIFVSARHGVQVWYWHEGDCDRCSRFNECRGLLPARSGSRLRDQEILRRWLMSCSTNLRGSYDRSHQETAWVVSYEGTDKKGEGIYILK
jgi:hypothetical protein